MYSSFLPPNLLISFFIALRIILQVSILLNFTLFISRLWLGSPSLPFTPIITRPISIIVDELVKPSIHLATVLCDSGELIQCLENIEPLANCLLVGVDVSSLYPNVDPKQAIIALNHLLREGKVRLKHLSWFQLTPLMFENNFRIQQWHIPSNVWVTNGHPLYQSPLQLFFGCHVTFLTSK